MEGLSSVRDEQEGGKGQSPPTSTQHPADRTRDRRNDVVCHIENELL